MSELITKGTEYIKKKQAGGILSMDDIRKRLNVPTAQQDNTKTKGANSTTPALMPKDVMGRSMTPATDQGEITATPNKSLREKAMSTLNYMDRDGKNMVAGIATEPLKASLRLMRPDKYFNGVRNDADIPGAIGTMIGDAAQVVPAYQELGLIKKGAGEAISLADSQLSKTGRALDDIRRVGIANRLSDSEIAAKQLTDVGITSAQRKAYMPGVSDVLYNRVQPYGYPESFPALMEQLSGNATKRTAEDVLRGGNADVYARTPRDLARDDAWRMYLGKPQRFSTFAPADDFQSAFNKDPGAQRFKLNREQDTDFSGLNSSMAQSAKRADGYHLGRGDAVMGNYDIMKRPDGMEYSDVWDLDPKVRLGYRNEKILDHDTGEFINLEHDRSVTVPISKFIGKPFHTNGLVPLERFDPAVQKLKAFEGLKKYQESIGNPTPKPTLADLKAKMQQAINIDPALKKVVGTIQ